MYYLGSKNEDEFVSTAVKLCYPMLTKKMDNGVKPLDEEMKIIMNKYVFVFFMWNEDNKLIIKYLKEDDINKSSFSNIIKIPTCILISGDLAFFATIVGEVNMSGCWWYWYTLSVKKWSNKWHAKGMLWTVDLLKNH